ncbi:MAG: phosphoribosylformimino-5-aminoimidazole carboxamide ribotide isomerase, partial [Actinomycetota bacterium]|nr:phosphoribosylformimino-5-aminoimidazole carboxamide ribotide isomerase [Actinomycetota bacterium]
MIVIPAIDLRGGRAVRLLRGNPDDETSYSEDPVAVAVKFQEEGARRLHVIDLDAALGEGDNRDAIQAICRSVVLPVQVGGGIRSIEAIGEVLKNGAARAILGTAAAADAEFVARAVEEFAEHIVVGLDIRGGKV